MLGLIRLKKRYQLHFMFKHLKSYRLFESISSEYKEDFEVLKDILSELRIDYFEIDYLTFNQTSSVFPVMKDSISKWERRKKFKNYVFNGDRGSLVEKEIEQVIIARIRRDKFYWKEVEEIVKELIHHMKHNGWQYIIEPVWKENSMGFQEEEMNYFDNQKLDLLCLKFYC